MTETNPYDPPKSKVNQSEVPIAELLIKLSPQKLQLAAWFAIGSLLVGSFALIAAFADSNRSGVIYTVSELLSWLSTGMWIYCLIMLEQLLTHRFSIEKLRPYLVILIVLNLIEAFLGMFVDFENLSAITIGYFALLFPYGLTLILLARKILKCPHVYSHLKSFAWLCLFGGICTASIVLILVSLPLLYIASFFLALSFFQAARELRSN